MAPAFLFYCLSFLDKNFRLLDLLHFAPFAILFFAYTPFIFISGDEKIGIATGEIASSGILATKWGWISFRLVAIHLLAYSLYIFNRVSTYLRINEGILDHRKLQQIKWVRFLNGLFFIYGFLMLFYLLLVSLNLGGMEKDYIISGIMCLAIYGISIIGAVNFDLLKGEKFVNKLAKTKYERTTLEDAELKTIIF